jgi:2,4-dienoyl-CoA reductase-like NADH-dependent reductase (Old Yellow Enzyme family)
MTVSEIEQVIEKFAEQPSFKGIQLHAAHGYLMAQFLSPKSNLMNDEFDGSAVKRTEVLTRILRKVREARRRAFV